MTNWEKVKENITIEDFIATLDHETDGSFCFAIRKIRGDKECFCSMSCDECYEWLKQEYKPLILTKEEKKYLSAVIKPFRDSVKYIEKLKADNKYYLRIIVYQIVEPNCITLPISNGIKMYSGMNLGKEYTLSELEL